MMSEVNVWELKGLFMEIVIIYHSIQYMIIVITYSSSTYLDIQSEWHKYIMYQ